MSALPAVSVETYEHLTPVTTVRLGGGLLRFVTPNRRTAWRVQTLLTKEPTTIEWLDTIEPGETLLDVGANMGLYTIYAAILRQARVDAIEPESQNFALLCSNIVLNNLTRSAAAWPIALSDVLRFDKLHLSDFGAGGSCHSFGESLNFKLEPQNFPLTQGCVAGTIDDLVAGGALRMPNHIKIDVDGIEHKVIGGALRTLENPELRSLIIETNPALAEHRQMIALLKQFGFALDPHQIARATRADGPFKGVAEHVFRR
jgi:FkbM family methyltransferase